ncbi:MAG: hypothetical protein Ta2A_04760 [Treponemataceae bacterium]|nr:MAG: hypothetical protein Ta2A_04760 [Treponemataceae bacterium]
MKKRKNTKFRADDFLVVILCLSSSLYFTCRFQADINKTLTKQNEEPIATVVFKENSTQRRFSDKNVWDRLKVDSDLYNNDTIHTDESALATIQFPSLAQIELTGNTLVQISVDENHEARVVITSGNVNINTNNATSGIVIMNSDKNSVHVAAGSIATIDMGQADGGGLHFQLLEGSASIVTSTGEVQEIDTPYSMSINSAGETSKNPAIIVTAPSPNMRIFTQNKVDNQILFSWQTQNISDDEIVKIQIAADKDFKKIISDAAVSARDNGTAGNRTYFANLETGVFYWRIVSENYPEAKASGKITVVYSPPPRLISPAAQDVIPYNDANMRVFFSWQEVASADSYRLVVARDAELSDIVSAVNFPTNSATVTLAEQGVFYWCVFPATSAANSGTISPSNVARFEVRPETEQKAPSLILPKNDETISIARNFKSSFSWKSHLYSSTTNYRFALSPNADMSAPVLQKEVQKPQFTFVPDENPGISTGVYYWAVYGQDTQGNISAASEIRKITLSYEESLLQNMLPLSGYETNTAQMPKIRFSWKSRIENHGTMQFQIARSSDFSDIVLNEKAFGSSTQGKLLPAGNYFWRITDGNESSDAFSLSIRDMFAAPALLEPAANTEVKGMANWPITFRWTEVPEAQTYRFRMFDATRGTQSRALIDRLIQNDTHTAVIPSDFSNAPDFSGTYTWSVEAFSPETATTAYRAGDTAYINVDIVRASPIIMSYPSNGAAFSGLQARNSPDAVQWSSSAPVVNTRFILATSPNPLTATAAQILLSVNDPAQEIRLPKLEEGTYYWIVAADDASGKNVNPVASFSFHVLPIPLLPAPSERVPTVNTVLSAAYFRQNRAIHFSWRPVAGATHYLFSLAMRGSNEILARQDSPDTSFDFGNLQNLDKGRFTWQVEAVEKDAAGNILRRGAVAENGFVIDLPNLQAPILTTPEILYDNLGSAD